MTNHNLDDVERMDFINNTVDDSRDAATVSECNATVTGALHLMHCTHSMSLNHSSVDELCLSSQALIEDVAKKINERVQKTLSDHSIDSSELQQEVAEACNPGNLFEGLQTKYTRERYYKDIFNYVVSNCIHKVFFMVCVYVCI